MYLFQADLILANPCLVRGIVVWAGGRPAREVWALGLGQEFVVQVSPPAVNRYRDSRVRLGLVCPLTEWESRVKGGGGR